MNNNWMQLIFVILVFGGGALQWVLRKLGEQAAQRKAQQGVARQRTEVLRTGRASTQSATSTAQAQPDVDLDSIAARRQRQLEELRRRQQAARRPTNTPQARPRPPQPPQQARSQQAGKSRQTAADLPSAVNRKANTSGKQTTLHALEHATTRPQKAHSHSADTGSEVLSDKLARESRQEAAKKEAKRKVEHASSAHGLVPRTAKEWRRAIIASEILAKPLSERSAEQHTG